MYKNVELKDAKRYSAPVTLTQEKVEKAIEKAILRVEKNAEKFQDKLAKPIDGFYFPAIPKGNSLHRYVPADSVSWTTGAWTGIFWHAYMYSGNGRFKDIAESHLKYYIKVAEENIDLDDHDTGFKFIPSCVAAYKLTGNKAARDAALKAAEILYEHYCPINKFIIRRGARRENERYDFYRMLVDSMMNIPLFFWAYEETGDKKFYDAAVAHYYTTAKYLIREDGSSYHHYQFDPVTLKPVGGVTLQGNRDESCWTRGHSWLLYGYPIAYKYTKDSEILDIHKSISYYFMDNLPKDNIPFWDFDFKDGSFEVRDSSAAAIACCGFMEMSKYLHDDEPYKKVILNASDIMLEALIDRCTDAGDDADCLLTHVTAARPQNGGIDNCATYGDYFYLEALIRKINPDCDLFW